ncbi:hypothetical protein RCO27_11290 [Sphingosinicella sp. LHD-64]|uniref:CC_3452 family protein n=1 Tax=Sphingosinicella sp. LHD-64 TaxID=3072139 RepID=UPI00280D969B|nr:hypothetical protein [Sphingosinicella sp. LHD-64]MDQ8756813.1 hypothetical protein [Sphingosinicella sp. LHD-64]
MKRVVSAGLAVIVLALSAPTLAQRQREMAATARVAPAFRGSERVAVDGRVWRCQGETCTGRVPADARGQERACTRLGLQLERILAFEVAGTPLSQETLTRCNRGRQPG